MVLQSQLNFSYVCFSYVKDDAPISEEQREKNRRYAEYEKERWRTYIMFLEWKKMAEERAKRIGPAIFGGPDPIHFRPE